MIRAGGVAVLAAGTTSSSPANGDSACLKSALALPDTVLNRDREARLSPLMQDKRPRWRPVRLDADAAASTDTGYSILSVVMTVAVSPPTTTLHAQQGPAQ